MVIAKQKAQGHRVSKKLTQARQREASAFALARDVKTLFQWLNHDVLELADPALAERQELYDFVVAELQLREAMGGKKVHVLCKALQNQRDDILGFAQVLDDKLSDIAQQQNTPLYLVREMCLLFRKQPTSNAYWQAWNQLHQKLSGQFYPLYEAVKAAMKQTRRHPAKGITGSACDQKTKLFCCGSPSTGFAIALRLSHIPIAAAPELLNPQQQHRLKLQPQ